MSRNHILIHRPTTIVLTYSKSRFRWSNTQSTSHHNRKKQEISQNKSFSFIRKHLVKKCPGDWTQEYDISIYKDIKYGREREVA